jgi:hypothetical protein
MMGVHVPSYHEQAVADNEKARDETRGLFTSLTPIRDYFAQQPAHIKNVCPPGYLQLAPPSTPPCIARSLSSAAAGSASVALGGSLELGT